MSKRETELNTAAVITDLNEIFEMENCALGSKSREVRCRPLRLSS